MEFTQYLTANQVCELCHISRRTLTNWINHGLPVHQPVPGGKVLFIAGEVDGWIQSRCTSTAPDHGGDDKAVS